MYRFRINAFDGDGGSAAAGAAGASGEASSQVAAGDRAGSIASEGTAAESTQQTFADYVKAHQAEYDEYSKKDFYTKFQKAFNRRHADYKQLQDRDKLNRQITDILSGKYGKDGEDIAGILESLKSDDSLYEDQAIEAGMTVDQYRRLSEAEAENRRFRAEETARQQRAEQETRVRQQMAAWTEQSNNLKQVFPNFDIESELQNPKFELALRGGMDVQSAFYAVHGPEIAANGMSYTAQAVRQATAEDLSTRRNRPAENGLAKRASAKVSKDVKSMSKADIFDIARRSMNGETIRF